MAVAMKRVVYVSICGYDDIQLAVKRLKLLSIHLF
jgi:hypothetical protein